MNSLRHKLTENIIYLQNEIRKRDDLLENSSEFGGDFNAEGAEDSNVGLDSSVNEENQSVRGGDLQSSEGDVAGGVYSYRNLQQMKRKRRTFSQALQAQIEDVRQQLKSQIEERMLA